MADKGFLIDDLLPDGTLPNFEIINNFLKIRPVRMAIAF